MVTDPHPRPSDDPPDGPLPEAPVPGRDPGIEDVPPSDPGEPPPDSQVAPGEESSPDFMRAG